MHVLLSPRLVLFRFTLGLSRGNSAAAVLPILTRSMGVGCAKEGGDLGLSRGQPCCKIPFLYQHCSENYCFVKSNICWGVGVMGWRRGSSGHQLSRCPGCLGETSFPYKSEL